MLRTRAPLTIASPFDLHVLGPPQTFALSQDQTLQFELCSIMIEDSLEPSTGCRCRARRFRSELHDPTGCGLEVHVPTSVMSWFPSSTIQFSGSVSLRPGPSRGGRLMLAIPSRQVFSCRDFLFKVAGCSTRVSHPPQLESLDLQLATSVRKSASKSRLLVRTVVRGGRYRVARREAGSTPNLVSRQAPFRSEVFSSGTGRPEPPRRRSEG